MQGSGDELAYRYSAFWVEKMKNSTCIYENNCDILMDVRIYQRENG